MSILMSELDAVNAILSVAGDAPVSSLASTYPQAIIARTILNRIVMEEQTKGLWFNESENITLIPDVLGEVYIPANTITLEISNDFGMYINRGTRIYDRENRTYKINKELKADIIEFLEWDLTPQSFRQYIVALAQHEYNNQYFGSKEVENTLNTKIAKTYITMKAEDIDKRDINLLNSVRSSSIAFSNRR